MFTPGTGVPAEQVHDLNPGIHPNGTFWTIALPDDTFHVSANGRRARFEAKGVPLPDTFFFANNVSVSAQIDVAASWAATGGPVSRGLGTGVPADDPGAFSAEFFDARCTSRVTGVETGFWWETGRLDASTFFAEIGWEKNGAFLT